MKRLWIAALFALAAAAPADIAYDVKVDPGANVLHVTMNIPNTQRGTKLQIPNWGPGGYVIRDGSRGVHNLKATDDKGQELKIDTQVDPISKRYQDGTEWKAAINPVTTWTVAPAKATIVLYDIDVPYTDGAMHWSGPSTYLYEVNRRKEKCFLEVDAPLAWGVYTGLVDDNRGHAMNGNGVTAHMFSAPDYDTFADNPVSTGGPEGLTVDTYVSRGKTHYIVMRGAAKANVDRAKLLKACKFVSDMGTDFFGDSAPYDHYVWHFAVNSAQDGAGGLEHLASTQITLAQGVGPRAVSVLAHEFFHLWNVKRIRSFPLGPFDYTKLPDTGAIWWLEGVTDYYAYTLLHRYGWTQDEDYFKTAASNLQIVLRNPAHTQISPNESSMRVDEANNGHGNSNGYLISYYNLGWLAGMCLDINLRAKTGGKHTLDDVEHALWDECKDGKPGFQEGEIRRLYVKMGGDGSTYDRIAMQPNMPVDEALALAGLKATMSDESFVDLGFAWGGGPGQTGLPLINIHGPASDKLQTGDRVIAVNGTALTGTTGRELQASMFAATRNAVAGTPIKLTVKRGDETMDVDVTPASGTRQVVTIGWSPDASPEQRALGQAWLATRQFKP